MADPKLVQQGQQTRKRILEILADEATSIGRLSRDLGISDTATRKHVLELARQGKLTYQPWGPVQVKRRRRKP